MSGAAKSRPQDIRRDRRRARHRCWGHLVAAPLWVAYTANLGTLLRTCDAVGACIAVPRTDHYREALAVGDTLGPRRRPCTHWVTGNRERWVRAQQASGWSVVAVELAEDAVPLPLLEPARGPSLVLLGHERQGVPEELVDLADTCVQIPMIGTGASLNVSVAASLVLYRLAGLS